MYQGRVWLPPDSRPERVILVDDTILGRRLLAASNRIGTEQVGHKMDFYGGSFIADHTGGMMAEMEEQAGSALATVDLDEVRRYREGWGLFRDIRPDIYA